MIWVVVVAGWALVSVLIAVTAGKAIDAAECARSTDGAHAAACDGCGAAMKDRITGWSIEVDEIYCPDCAAVREDTWGYRCQPLPAHIDSDHQIITTLIGRATRLPASDPRAHRWATEALALAGAVELPLLIEEAEGVLGRIDHDTTCLWCNEIPGAQIPTNSFWCRN